jgi:hypothetical protein
MSDVLIGMPWYRAEEYAQVRERFDDRERLPEQFEEWEAGAGKLMRSLKLDGHKVIKIILDVEEFESWCRERKLKLNREARSRYAAEEARARAHRGEA